MKFNPSRRDFKFFFLGFLAAFIFITIYDWEDNVESFKKGYIEGRRDYKISREE